MGNNIRDFKPYEAMANAGLGELLFQGFIQSTGYRTMVSGPETKATRNGGKWSVRTIHFEKILDDIANATFVNGNLTAIAASLTIRQYEEWTEEYWENVEAKILYKDQITGAKATVVLMRDIMLTPIRKPIWRPRRADEFRWDLSE